MYNQEPKKLIDVGEIGNASTGDILFDGGEKLNSNMNAIYNAFGDQRKMSLADGTGADGQKIHATGYYQKADTRDYYALPVELGSMHDIDTTDGGVIVTLDKGKQGEAVEFINSNGSISVNNPLTVIPQNSFKNLAGNLTVTAPFTRIVCRCISDSTQEGSVWDYSIESLFGQKQIPTDGTWSIGAAGGIDIPLFHRTEYNTAKLLITCQSTDGKKIKSAELNILIDTLNSSVISTEYAVMRVGNIDGEDEIAKITFKIDASNMVAVNIASSITGLRAAVKVIATQKIGVPQ